jgi:hypothetical protein
MRKIWRVALPAAQLLIVVGAVDWYRSEKSVNIAVVYAYPTRDIVMKLNFPVILVWSPIVGVMEHFSGYLNPTSTVMMAVSLVLFVAASSLSIFLFWYFLAVEVEMRFQNRSMIRFKNWPAETCKALVFFAVGIGSIVYAIFEASRLLHRSNADAVVGGALLLAWGAIFIATSVSDVAFFVRTRR